VVNRGVGVNWLENERSYCVMVCIVNGTEFFEIAHVVLTKHSNFGLMTPNSGKIAAFDFLSLHDPNQTPL
jgi:predicted TIM-barrel enzyme